MKKHLPWITILVASIAIHFAFFGHPKEVVFDEVWYGRHVNDYLKGTFHFDGHPPLGRMTIAGFASLFDYDPSFGFQNIGEEFPNNKYLVLRFLPSLAGALLPVIIFLLLTELGMSKFAALAGGLLVAFENALLVQSRFLLMDSFLLLYGFTSLLFYARYRKRGGNVNLFLTGIFASFAFSVKWVGLSFVVLPMLVESFVLLRERTWKKYFRSFTALTVVPIVVYFLVITAYSSLLNNSGTGDAFMSPQYQKTLKGNSYETNEDIQPSNIFQKFTELNVQMYKVNQNLTATHPYSSKWYTWPLLQRPIYYWNGDGAPISRIYLMGNPIIWWASTFGILYFLINSFTVKNKFFWLVSGAYLLNMLPFVGIDRAMFLYHYFTGLIIAIIALMYFIDSLKNHKRIFAGLLIASFAAFLFFAPLSYGLPLSDKAYNARVWINSWR